MGKAKTQPSDLASPIIETLRSSENGKSMDLKELRKSVLIAANLLSDGSEDIDKSSKKLFKEAVKFLEKDEKISLNADGVVKLSKTERSKTTTETKKESEIDEDSEKKKKKKKKDGKRKRELVDDDADGDDYDNENNKKDKKVKKKKKSSRKESENHADNHVDTHDQAEVDNDDEEEGDEHPNNPDESAGEKYTTGEVEPANKNKPCKNNPLGITRLFLGNLPFTVSEPTLNAHLNDTITHIKWITDKTTGKFYGSAFVEVRNSKDAAKAMKEINGSLLMGRPIKINYAPMRPGEEKDWPPKSKVITGGKVANAGGGQAGGKGLKAMSVKPEGCCKLFIGNLSYDIDDEGITKFFMGVEAEIKAVRWLYHKESGDFKGCGYVDFWNTEACEKAATLNGKNLLGRPIRIDWAE